MLAPHLCRVRALVIGAGLLHVPKEMGGMCSAVEKQEGFSKVSFASRSTKVLAKEQEGIIKGASEFENMVRGSKVAADDKVCAAAKMHDENAEDLPELYVVREVAKSAMPVADMDSLRQHLLTLGNLEHMNICRFVEAFDTGKALQLVYERADEKSVFEEDPNLQKGRAISTDVAGCYIRQVLMALSVAHRAGIAHGRLSDRALLLELPDEEDPQSAEDRCIKICDFGQTWFMRDVRKSSKLDFEAPENLWNELPSSSSPKAEENTKAYSSCDMWSVGIIAFRMLTGKLPFPDVDAIKTSTVTFGPEWDKMPDAREVVQGLLKKSSHIRPPAERVLRMPWLAVARGTSQTVSRSKIVRVLKNVMQNCTESTFKKFAMRVMAEEMSPEKQEVVEKAFRHIDKNGDGTLEVEEIRSALRKFLKQEHEAVDAADGIFEAIDRDASGSLNFAEFMAVSIGPQDYCDKVALWECFNRFDKDGNGSFDKDEITTVVKEVEHLAEDTQIEDVVKGIAEEVEMPMDFDCFVQCMVTPAGKPVDMGKASLNRICYSVFKVDNHKVRHINPKCKELEGQLARKNTLTSRGGARRRTSEKL